jgi:hypothetical protein
MKNETFVKVTSTTGFIIFLIFMVFLFTPTVFGQDTSGDYDVLVGGYYQGHDMDVMMSFIEGYSEYDNSIYPGTITWPRVYGVSLFPYADANGYEIIVYSYTGINNQISWAYMYPEIRLVMTAGCNCFAKVFHANIETCPIVSTGAGATTNTTGYNVEFHSIDPIYGLYSSFSNGYIAGQITYIAVSRGITFQEARMIARETSSNVIWDEYSGYGLINIEDALAFIVSTPSEMVQDIIDEIDELIINGYLTGNHAQPLITKLERVIDKLDENKITPAINQLGAFINQVNEYINSDKLTEVEGQSLIILAEEVIDELMFLVKISPELSEDNSNIPDEYRLEQNYPNPFNPVTTIEYVIPEAGNVKLIIYDILGNKVKTLVNEYITNNHNTVKFDATGLSSGTYIYSLNMNGNSINKKLVLLK